MQIVLNLTKIDLHKSRARVPSKDWLKRRLNVLVHFKMAVSDEAKASFSFKLTSKSNKFTKEKDSLFSGNVPNYNEEDKDYILSAEGQELKR